MTAGIEPRKADSLKPREVFRRWLVTRHYSPRTKAINKQGGKPTKFRGICWHQRRKQWQASICKSGLKIHVGYFDSEELAASAYDKKAVELFGEFASLNHVAAPVERRIKSPLDA